jgi:hypothetical protein
MPVADLVGQQIRMRVADPKTCAKFRTQDVGRVGHTQRVACVDRKTGRWKPQSWRVNLMDYGIYADANRSITDLERKGQISSVQASKARQIAKKWFRSVL